MQWYWHQRQHNQQHRDAYPPRSQFNNPPFNAPHNIDGSNPNNMPPSNKVCIRAGVATCFVEPCTVVSISKLSVIALPSSSIKITILASLIRSAELGQAIHNDKIS